MFLETDRLVLRAFAESDMDDLVELDSDPEVMRWLTGGRPTPRAEVESRVLPTFLGGGFWAAEEKPGSAFLGWFELRSRDGDRPGEVELGYRLRRSAWGRGYATEGARALVRKGFTELDVWRTYARTMAVNLASRRVLEKAGLRYVRTFHQDWPEPIEGSEHGEVEYALEHPDWNP
ncbi:GNAT family N-acetyltransferase [Amycolatopsis cihanbeyliensis]|uniref:RimJ/RimL family protein N-acetyltransferase n=1 Tax=Amycolatopsis cihanbeyliensis TaxID=1128664 RepID=A0A542CU37_AMYCI|nr:GNAT family N-acetyltransferase [Amycolatopsis cihanbeyliensis]TQI94333.1 RimJ/RimL family protein N-acetyltransferase [Amycolatopsis cihanbeyliensis]